jgi:hypothetical protein
MDDKAIMPARTMRDYLSSSLVWKDFLDRGGFVPGDIVVADPFKAGTTWTQRILQQILDDGEERTEALSDTSPWLDSSTAPSATCAPAPSRWLRSAARMEDPKKFFHKGPARDYRTELTPDQSERFDRTALEKLGPACARWLETGDLGVDAPRRAVA